LQGAGPFTVFAPTDDAFAAALTALKIDKAALLNRADLGDILKYHVLSGAKVMAADLKASQTVATLNGLPVTITKAANVMFADAKVTSADVAASNGVIHVIDKVIIPPTVDIVGTAIANGNFGILAEALTKAGLVGALQGAGPFTVFAPTDDAFAAALTALNISKAALLNRADLGYILRYHVLSGAKVMAADLTASQAVKMFNGLPVTITKAANVMIGDAKVTTADVDASNGVIHVIDKVVMPPVNLMDVEAKILTGEMTVKVTLPQDQTIQQYVGDAKVQKGYKTAIATQLGCDESWVSKLALSVAGAGSRRLAAHMASVKVDYEITVPKEDVAKGAADTLTTAVKSAGNSNTAKASFAAAITNAVSSSTGTAYDAVTVDQVAAATVADKPVTTTSAPAPAAGTCRTVFSAVTLLVGIAAHN
jgi:transforming growth factor-beta-induced protein